MGETPMPRMLAVAPDEPGEEGEGGDVHEDVDVAPFAFGELDEAVADEAEADAVGDGVGQGDGQEGEEGGDGVFEVFEIDSADLGDHQDADDDQGGRCRVKGNERGEG